MMRSPQRMQACLLAGPVDEGLRMEGALRKVEKNRGHIVSDYRISGANGLSKTLAGVQR